MTLNSNIPILSFVVKFEYNSGFEDGKLRNPRIKILKSFASIHPPKVR
jgi:hypothetical protein